MKTKTYNALKIAGYLIISAFLLSSCAPSAHIERDDSVDFKKYKSYSWIDKNGSGKMDQGRKNDLQERKFREAINMELKKQDWAEVSTRPDVLLSYDVLVENSSKEKSEPVYSQSYIRQYYNPYTRRWFSVYYPSRFLGYDRYDVPVKEGTTTVTMIDAKTDKMVWQGWVTNEVKNRNLTKNEIQGAVKSIFRKFDVAKK